jgi:hypothetical protein
MCSENLIRLNHYLCGFNNSNHRVALLELQLFGAAPCDGALDEIVAHSDDHMGHDITQLDFFDSPRSLFLAEIVIR